VPRNDAGEISREDAEQLAWFARRVQDVALETADERLMVLLDALADPEEAAQQMRLEALPSVRIKSSGIASRTEVWIDGVLQRDVVAVAWSCDGPGAFCRATVTFEHVEIDAVGTPPA
jgi:hypothetical protein